MSPDSAVVLLLGLCCAAVAAVQAGDWHRRWLISVAAMLAAGLIIESDMASRTSLADAMRWASSPQRRQDLAALLLAEALLFGGLAVRQAQADMGLAWRALGALPPPSLLLTLFLVQVLVMLSIDGIDYAVLSWPFGGACALLFTAAALGVRKVLPSTALRASLRVALHGVQAAAGLWLARPAFAAGVDPTPPWGERLAVVAAIAAALAAAGWLRWRIASH
ncbi:hypothetical protein [Roseateles sp.]|uniref:hypothetical protein n=1 Tax=Roseateles sp. TaxID=1971397 RepID=UPI0025D82F32|nr:hypothetical protein [Roseateles sp.]MBV8036122.1 hypothetical protein [Roseateles sp.]